MDLGLGQFGNVDGDGFPPLERRMIDLQLGKGPVKRVPALNKSYAPPFKYINFYLPKLDVADENPSILQDWKNYMEMLRDDMRWLLKLPHYKFWSTMVYSIEISDDVLPSFLMRAPRFYEPEFDEYQKHPDIAPLYNDIYTLVFRIYLRLSTFKENKEDHIGASTWASLIYDNYLFDIPKLMDICALYENKDNHLLPKMVENILKYEPRFVQGLDLIIPITMQKSIELGKELESRVKQSEQEEKWNFQEFQEILTFIIDGTVALYKLLKVHPPLSEHFHRASNFELLLASSYERNVTLWGQVLPHLPVLETQVHALRVYLIRLFRIVLFLPTLGSASSSTDSRIDDFFNGLTSYLDEKFLIHDYEKAYPFKRDMQTLLSRGIYVDETRIEYLSNAIASCFQACGENYSVEKLVTDPLYDPHFDRQLLGACSLDITGVELQSLISQVKDLFPDLPDSYIEVCLKHFGYSTETTINALLENTVPSSLDKYKNPEFVQSQSSQVVSIRLNDEPIRDELPAQLLSSDFLQSGWSEISEQDTGFWKARSSKRPEDTVNQDTIFEGSKVLKERILRNLQADAEAAAARARDEINTRPYRQDFERDSSSYIDESLLPIYNEDIEYNDEYDDTYDEVGVGMTEPDNVLFKPLNYKAHEIRDHDNHNDNGMEDAAESEQEYAKRNDHFVEDPAIIRAKLEEKRLHKFHQQHGGKFVHQNNQQGDVVGKAKGHGQEKEVLLNRRSKDQAGSHNRRKRSDWKRKEF